MSCIDKRRFSGISIYKRFDVVDHSILLKKLHLYKLSETSLQWFSSYLSNRKQAVDNGQGHSDLVGVKSGVPQGSILGPTLILLFINDLPLFTKVYFSVFYADDATVHTQSNIFATIECNLQTDGDEVKTWGKQNKIHIRCIKTSCMVLGPRHR